jgi:hypothetical protein
MEEYGAGIFSASGENLWPKAEAKTGAGGTENTEKADPPPLGCSHEEGIGPFRGLFAVVCPSTTEVPIKF